MKKVITYSIVNLIGGILDVLFLFIFVNFFNIYYLYALVLSFALSDGFEYIYYRNYLFKVRGIRVWRLIKYVFFKSINLGILVLIMWIFVSVLGIYYLISRVISGVLLMMAGVILQSKYTFSD